VTDRKYQVIIVGAGPAGLCAGIFAQKKRLSVIVVDGSRAGGQLVSLYPQKPVYNYPGYAEITAGELAQKMTEQVQAEGVSLLENFPVQSISTGRDGGYHLEVPGASYQAEAVILASGMGLFQPAKLGVPGEKELTDNGIFYALREPRKWQNKRIAIIGGGNSALDNALLLKKYTCEVTLIHKLDRFQAEAGSVEQINNSGIKVLMESKVDGFSSENGHIMLSVKINNERNERSIAVDHVLINIGVRTSYAFLDNLPLARNKKKITVDSEMKTSLAGIFACGDVVSYPGKVRLIVTAIGEAATAVNSAEEYLKSKTGSEAEHES
jgi:ferredoxin/flavodoxin---NADP+ reductase